MTIYENKNQLCDFSIVAPVYNEEDVIEKVILSWIMFVQKKNLDAEIVLTDDGSSDQTPSILRRMQNKYSLLKVIRHDSNTGYGHAVQTAINNAVGNIIITIDSDGQFDLGDSIPLYEKLSTLGFDMVSGFRVNKKDTRIKVIADRLLNFSIKIFFGVKFRDTNCALKIIKREKLKDIVIESSGYPAPTELQLKMSKMGFKIAESGIHHFKRDGGRSKLDTFKVGIHMISFLIYLKFKMILVNKGILRRL